MSSLKTAGVSLIEILISLLITAISIVGIISLSLNFTKVNYNNYIKNQASIVASDVIERIRSNDTQLNAYLLMDVGVDPGIGPDCSLDLGCTDTQIFQRDAVHFYQQFQELKADLSIVQVGSLGVLRLTINWEAQYISATEEAGQDFYKIDFEI